MPKARLIDPSLSRDDVRIVPALGDRAVKAGETVEASKEVIGVQPYWRAPKPGDELDFLETRTEDPEDTSVVTSVHDLGYGLLAQVGVWESVSDTPPEIKPAAKVEKTES